VELAPFLQALGRRGKLDLSNLIEFCSSVSLFTRPPRHEAVRRMLGQALSRIWRMNLPELLSGRAEQLLAVGEREGVIDLAGGFGWPLALFVIATFLGIGEGDLHELSAKARDLIVVFERVIPSVSTLTKLDKSAAALNDYFLRLLRARRRNRADDGISLMLKVADECLGCSDQELAGYCTFFFAAAEETTAASISGSALILLQHALLREQIQSDPSRLPDAVGEMLRLVSPVQFVVRKMRNDIYLGDQLVRADEPLLLMLGAANRDPEVYPKPDEPELNRTGPESLVFAVGPYRCIGAQLAAFEVETAMRKLLSKRRLRLASQPALWTERRNIATLLHLPACFS
jgi:cytochrome P450